jgi:hypothetical protein
VILVFKDGAVIATHEDHQRDRIADAYPGARLLVTGAEIAWDPDPGGFYPGRLGANQSERFLADTGLERVEGQWRIAVRKVQALALAAIDHAAGEARNRFITDAPGQEGVYAIKREAAEKFKAANYLGPVPVIIQAEATAQEMTATQATDYVLATAEVWITIAAQIEQLRLTGKNAVRAGTTSQAVDAILADTLSALEAIRPSP